MHHSCPSLSCHAVRQVFSKAASQMQASTAVIMSSHQRNRGRQIDSNDDVSIHQLLTIVLAEDDDDLRSILADLLRKDGYRVIEARDGGYLMAGLSCWCFDGLSIGQNVLLVTDARMPNADGLSVIRTLAAQGRTPRFILMTAFGEPQLHAEARQLGALAVFDKPFDFDDLRRTVRQVALRIALH
jgi:two-component system, response regulator, stage 0 sporulation protein F